MADELAFLLILNIVITLKLVQATSTVTGCVDPLGNRVPVLRTCGCHNDGEQWENGKCNCAGGLVITNVSVVVQCNTISPSVCDVKCGPNNGCIVRVHLVNAANVKHVWAPVPILAPNTAPEVYECCVGNDCNTSIDTCSTFYRNKRIAKTAAESNDYTCCPVYTNQDTSQCKAIAREKNL